MDISDITRDFIQMINRQISKHNLPYQPYKSELSNGFFNIDASKVYHIGYYSMYLAFFGAIITSIILYHNTQLNQKKKA